MSDGVQRLAALAPSTPAATRGAELSNGDGRLLTADELAERWSVSKAHIYRLAREARIPVVMIGRYQRFRPAAIEAWERAQEEAADG